MKEIGPKNFKFDAAIDVDKYPSRFKLKISLNKCASLDALPYREDIMSKLLTNDDDLEYDPDEAEGGEGGETEVNVGGVGGQLPPPRPQQHDVDKYQIQAYSYIVNTYISVHMYNLQYSILYGVNLLFINPGTGTGTGMLSR